MVHETNGAFPNLSGLRVHLVAPSLAAQLTDAALAAEGEDLTAASLGAIVTAELSCGARARTG
jgi:hypothetical protein